MLQPIQIKLEPDEDKRKLLKKKKKIQRSLESLKCTCSSEPGSQESSHLESPTNSNKHRQILVNFGLRRRKIFNLSDDDNVYKMFSSFISGEPAFSKLLDNAYVVLQEYNTKFGTYVDVDDSGNLRDGSVLKAVFFPTGLVRDDENPGCIKTKDRKSFSNCSDDLILIDSSDDDSEVKSSVSNSRVECTSQVQLPPKQRSEKKSKRKKSYVEDTSEVQSPPIQDSEKKKCKLKKSCDKDTSEVHVPLEQRPEKKLKTVKKNHCLEEHQNNRGECAEKVSGIQEKDIKIESNSEKQLAVAKSTCVVSNNQHSPKQRVLLETPLMTKGTNVSSLPASTRRDLIPSSNGSYLDSAVSQNCNQTRSNHSRHQSGGKDSRIRDFIDDVADPITHLSQVCKMEQLRQPSYSIISSQPFPKYKVRVDELTFLGSGRLFQTAKQEAARMALRYMHTRYSCNEKREINGSSKEKGIGNIRELSVYDKGGRVQNVGAMERRREGKSSGTERSGCVHRNNRDGWRYRSWRGGRGGRGQERR